MKKMAAYMHVENSMRGGTIAFTSNKMAAKDIRYVKKRLKFIILNYGFLLCL